MSIDTAAKRRSAAGIPFLPLGPGVTPDATPGQEWRQQAGWGYSGILAGSPVTIVGEVVLSFAAAQPSLTYAAAQPALTFSTDQGS